MSGDTVVARDRPEARLSIRIDGDDGQPVEAARLHLTDARGEPILPDGGLPYHLERPFGSETHVVVPGQCQVEVPAGPVTVRVEGGPELLADQTTTEVAVGTIQHVHLQARRWIDMGRSGWFAGDLHGHRPAGDMPMLMAAEQLHVGSSITRHNGRPRQGGRPSDPSWLRRVGSGRWCTVADVEVERLEEGTGAFLAVGVPSGAATSGSLAASVGAWEPLDLDLAAALRSSGAHLHAEKPFWRITPVLVAFGLADSIGVVNNHLGRSWSYPDIGPLGACVPEDGIPDGDELVRWLLALHDRFLDCGFRLPAAGGSASGWMPNPLGSARTYAWLGAGVDPSPPAHHRRWLDALAAGRSFSTNGPMVWLAVDGHGPGQTLPADARGRLHVTVEAQAAHPLERIELVRDGETVAERSSVRGAVPPLEVELDPSVGGWLAARAFGSDLSAPRVGATSAVWLGGGRPSRRRAQAATGIVRWLGDTLEHLQQQRDPVPRRLVATFVEAQDRYRALAAAPPRERPASAPGRTTEPRAPRRRRLP